MSSTEIGNEIIDLHHKIFSDIFRKLRNKKIIEKDQEGLKKLLNFLLSFFEYHIEHEEELMEELKFPDLANHREHHSVFRDSLINALEQMKENKLPNPEKLMNFLSNWLEKHFEQEDEKLVKALSLHNKYGRERLFFLENEEKETIHKISKLRMFFTQKLITADDYKEQKIRLVEKFLTNFGLSQIALLINLLRFFKETGLLSDIEANSSLSSFLKKTGPDEALAEIGEIEGQLHYLKVMFELGIMPAEEYDRLKLKVFQDIGMDISIDKS